MKALKRVLLKFLKRLSWKSSKIILKLILKIISRSVSDAPFLQVVTPPFLTHHPPVHPHVRVEQASFMSVAVLRPVLAVQTAFPIRLFHIALFFYVIAYARNFQTAASREISQIRFKFLKIIVFNNLDSFPPDRAQSLISGRKAILYRSPIPPRTSPG